MGKWVGNYPSRDLQGGSKLACGAGSQKPVKTILNAEEKIPGQVVI